MEESFPARMLRNIETSLLSDSELGERLQVERSTVWRLKKALLRGVLPDLALVIAVYWALGYDKQQLDTVARFYTLAKQATPLRRDTTEHRSTIKAQEERRSEVSQRSLMRA